MTASPRTAVPVTASQAAQRTGLAHDPSSMLRWYPQARIGKDQLDLSYFITELNEPAPLPTVHPL